MVDRQRQHACPRCAELEARIAELESQLAKARKHSGNSSKPPSGDIVAAPKTHRKPGRPKKQKIGGQPGHVRHLRTPFRPEEIDRHWVWAYDQCPCCGGGLVDADAPPRVLQQVELLETPVRIEQHDSQPQRCTRCNKTFTPEFPQSLRKAGLIGPRLTALVGYLKGPCHMSFSSIRKFLRDCVGVSISRGMLGKLIGKVSASLADPYEALLAMLPSEDLLNVDETGHK